MAKISSSVYRIDPGETLGGIAQSLGTTVQEIQRLNTNITDPNKIFAGQSLVIPSEQVSQVPQPPQATPGPVPQVQTPVAQQTGQQAQPTPQQVQQQTPQVQQTGQTGQVNQTTGQPTNMVQVTPEQYQQIQELSARANELLGTNIDVTPQVDETQTQEEAPKNTLSLFDEAMGGSVSGFDDLFKQFGISTNNSIEDVVKTLSQAYGMESINKEIEGLDAQYADDVMSVNSNPWLSEGLRSKKISLLQDKYETKKNAYIDRLKLQGDIVGQALTLYENEKQLQKDLLFQAITERQNEIENQIAVAKLNQAQGFELSQGQSRYEYNPDTGQYEVVASVAPAPKSISEINNLPYQIVTQIDKLSSSFDSSPIVKNYVEVQNKKLSVDSILNTGIRGPADLALVFEFMKALDPTSVVRESEYESAAKSGNIFAGTFAKFNGYLREGGGFLPEKVRSDFQQLINSKFSVATKQYENLRDETARKINIKTGSDDGSDYLTDYSGVVNKFQLDTSNLPKTDVEMQGQDDGGFWNSILSLFK